MKVGLTANPTKPGALELARWVAERLDGRAETVLDDAAAPSDPRRPHSALEKLEADVIVALGGDGTFLGTLRRSAVPVLPVSMGTVGVLAEVDGRRRDDVAEALDRLLSGRYHLEEPMKLAAEVQGRSLPDAVNEYVVHSDRVGKMGWFALAINGVEGGTLQADGLIVATPTGSTAYALSSLGPIVDPAVEGIVVTAIAPFRVGARALLLDPLASVSVQALDGTGTVVLADGVEEARLPPEGSVTVHRSLRRASFVRFGTPFFERLRGKRILPWNEEPAREGRGDAAVPSPP